MARVDTLLSWSLEISQRKKVIMMAQTRGLQSRQFSLDSLIRVVIGLTGGHCSLLQSRDRRSWRLTRQDQLVLAQQETVHIDADRGPDIVLPMIVGMVLLNPAAVKKREGKTPDMDVKTPPPQKITCINKWKDQAFHIKENGGSIQKLILVIRKTRKVLFFYTWVSGSKTLYQSNMKSLHSSAREKV